MKISVITPTIRPDGLAIVANSLKNQSFQNWEWIICSPKKLEKEIRKVIGDIVPFKFIGNPPLKSGQFWDLNYSYNQLIENSSGELLVSWQDWVYADSDGLEKFWTNYIATYKKALISGVGNQYAELDRFSKATILVWKDPRLTDKYGSFYECYFPDIEYNFCAAPKKVLHDVGGFCEKLDYRGYGMDGYQVNERLNELGYKFYLDQNNKSYSIYHDRSAHGGQENWDIHNNLTNGEYEKVRQEFKDRGEWPRMKYLTIDK